MFSIGAGRPDQQSGRANNVYPTLFANALKTLFRTKIRDCLAAKKCPREYRCWHSKKSGHARRLLVSKLRLASGGSNERRCENKQIKETIEKPIRNRFLFTFDFGRTAAQASKKEDRGDSRKPEESCGGILQTAPDRKLLLVSPIGEGTFQPIS